MIVVTGPGRSGTSFLAALYKELGFDPGGRFEPAVGAGLEAYEVRTTNLRLVEELGLSTKQRRGGPLVALLAPALPRLEHRVPPVHRALVSVVDRLRYRRTTPDLMRWDQLEAVVERHGEELRSMAKERQVVKDPRFCFTLRAWLASGAPVEAIVCTIRPLDAMADSRVRVRMYSERARDWGKHNYCYGLGLLLTAAAEHRVPVVTLRFPDFLDDPAELHRVLPWPEAVSRERFEQAFAATYDPALVHDSR